MARKEKKRKGMIRKRFFLLFAVFSIILTILFSFIIYIVCSGVIIRDYGRIEEVIVNKTAETISEDYADIIKNPEKSSEKDINKLNQYMTKSLETLDAGVVAVYTLDASNNANLLTFVGEGMLPKGDIFSEELYDTFIWVSDSRVLEDVYIENYYSVKSVSENNNESEDKDGVYSLIYFHSVYAIIMDSDGVTPIGVCFIDNSEIMIEDCFSFFLVILISAGIFISVLSLILSIIASNMFIRPIGQLTKQVTDYSLSNFENKFEGKIKSGDEIEILQETFIRLSEKLQEATKNRVEEAAENEKELTQYNVYKELKEVLTPLKFNLPPESFIEMSNIDIITTKAEADCCNYFIREDGKVVFIAASSNELGIMATMYMLIAVAIIRSYIRTELDFEKSVTEINRQIYRNLSSSHSIDVFFGMIDSDTSSLYTINCGSSPAIYSDIRHNVSHITGRIYDALGMTENVNYKADVMKITEGDVIYVTNGKFDRSKNIHGKIFDIYNISDILTDVHNRELNEKEILYKIEADIIQFLKGARLENEVLMLAVSYHKPDKKLAEKTLRPDMNNVGRLKEFIKLQLDQNEIHPKVNALLMVITEELFGIFCNNTAGGKIKTICDIDENKYLKLDMSARIFGDENIFDESNNEAVHFVKSHADRFEMENDGRHIIVKFEKQL
ncbi:MAG: SpoIIE family protein phosphatase [Lachnospiraceae bacterium]|nr:SpoIIE family protein phosphatase [Lachnospiraceae bacterium]